MNSLKELIKDLKTAVNPERAKNLQWFFKTGKGEYGEGDIFVGISVPDLRKIAKKWQQLGLTEIQILLENQIHEYRQIAIFILVNQYEKLTDSVKQNNIKDFYLQAARKNQINNWDLVDASTGKIIGN